MSSRRYSSTGEWVEEVNGHWRVGLASATAEDLGDVTFVELPAIGRTVQPGEVVCAIEAVKAATDFFTPVSGTISNVNHDLVKNPELVSQSPEENGWIFEIAEVSSSEWSRLAGAPQSGSD